MGQQKIRVARIAQRSLPSTTRAEDHRKEEEDQLPTREPKEDHAGVREPEASHGGYRALYVTGLKK